MMKVDTSVETKGYQKNVPTSSLKTLNPIATIVYESKLALESN
jgi:hypothetical protein